jgi:hypothetical protein
MVHVNFARINVQSVFIRAKYILLLGTSGDCLKKIHNLIKHSSIPKRIGETEEG